jgi:hypothetical protein
MLRIIITGQMSVRRSTDGGNSFQNAVVIVDNIACGLDCIGFAQPQVRPSLAVSPNGHVFMATNDARDPLTPDPSPILRFFRSTNNGVSWTETWQRDSGPGFHDFFPTVVVTPNELVHVSFMHSEAANPCTFQPNTTSNWITVSSDDGLTFAEPIQVSAEFSTIPSDPSQYLFYFEADAAVGLTDDKVYPVWTEHRNGYQAPWSAKIDPPPAPPQNVDWYGNPGQHPTITWDHNTEPDLAGYDVYKGTGTYPYYVKLNSSLVTNNYYTDVTETINNNQQGGYNVPYWLRAVDQAMQESDTSSHVIVPVVGDWTQDKRATPRETGLPSVYSLHAAYPNPFNPSTSIKFDLPEPGVVSLVVYDILGRKVVELVNGVQEAGYHSIEWDASNVGSGVYLARFTASDETGRLRYTNVRKLLLTK